MHPARFLGSELSNDFELGGEAGCGTRAYGTTRVDSRPPLLRVSISTRKRPQSWCRFGRSRERVVRAVVVVAGRRAMTGSYLLKEALRYVFAVKGDEGKQAVDRWASWARRSRMPAFVQLHRRIAAHRPAIDAALSQGLVESTNTKIRLLTRIAFGFHGYQPLVALAMLALGSHPPRLPGRN